MKKTKLPECVKKWITNLIKMNSHNIGEAAETEIENEGSNQERIRKLPGDLRGIMRIVKTTTIMKVEDWILTF